MRLITVKMPETYIDGLDELVKLGRYSSRSEAIRIAVRELLRRELWGLEENQWPARASEENHDHIIVVLEREEPRQVRLET